MVRPLRGTTAIAGEAGGGGGSSKKIGYRCAAVGLKDTPEWIPTDREKDTRMDTK